MMTGNHGPLGKKTMSVSFAHFALAAVGAVILPMSSATAAVAETNCCTSGSACADMIQKLEDACDAGQDSLINTCNSIHGLMTYEWLLHNPDLSPLGSDSKDFAGTYQLTVGDDFILTNKWLRGDAPGISSNGDSEINLKKICYNTTQVAIAGTVKAILFSIPFQLSFKTEPAVVKGVKGYFGSGKAQGTEKAYFFTPVKSDRTPITEF